MMHALVESLNGVFEHRFFRSHEPIHCDTRRNEKAYGHQGSRLSGRSVTSPVLAAGKCCSLLEKQTLELGRGPNQRRAGECGSAGATLQQVRCRLCALAHRTRVALANTVAAVLL